MYSYWRMNCWKSFSYLMQPSVASNTYRIIYNRTKQV